MARKEPAGAALPAEKPNAVAASEVRFCFNDNTPMNQHHESGGIVHRCPTCWRTERSAQGSSIIEVQPGLEMK
jgi:hypothetical protein